MQSSMLLLLLHNTDLRNCRSVIELCRSVNRPGLVLVVIIELKFSFVNRIKANF